MPYPFSAGEILTAANLNDILEPKFCLLTRTATQSAGDAANTQIAWDAQTLDAFGWHPADGVTAGITPNIAGWYQMTYTVDFSADNDYVQVRVLLFKNGAQFTLGGVNYINDTYPVQQSVSPVVSGDFPLVNVNGTSDTVSLAVFQDNTSGSASTITAACMLRLVLRT